MGVHLLQTFLTSLNDRSIKEIHLKNIAGKIIAVDVSIYLYRFKEKTNVFAYYIIKNLLLYFNVDFLIWCKQHNNNILTFNKNSATLDSFINFINEKHNNANLLKDIDKMHQFLKKQKGNRAEPKHNKLTKTMRMSLCELNLN